MAPAEPRAGAACRRACACPHPLRRRRSGCDAPALERRLRPLRHLRRPIRNALHSPRGLRVVGRALNVWRLPVVSAEPGHLVPPSPHSSPRMNGERSFSPRSVLMSELLLELFSEEIPARMQPRAAEDLKRLVIDGLKTRGLETGAATAFSTPRRLTLVVEDVPQISGDLGRKEGPARRRAGAGRAGLPEIRWPRLDQGCNDRQGREEGRLLRRQDREARPRSRRNHRRDGRRCGGKFPWPKSMRWGSSPFQWVRPLQSVLCLLDGKVVPFEIAGWSRRRNARPPLPRTRTVQGQKFRRLRRETRRASRDADPAEARAAITEQAEALAKKQSSSSSRTRRCSPRTPDSPNGRSC